MSKVTSKLQLTLPKEIAQRYGIKPGMEVEWVAGADSLRLVPPRRVKLRFTMPERLKLFDASTLRQKRRQESQPKSGKTLDRGWKRSELYDRGFPR